MISLHHGNPESHLKLTPHNYLRHLYAVHAHMAVFSHSYPHYSSQILRFWVTCGDKLCQCHCVVVKVHSHLKVLPSSITDINTVFWHIDILIKGIRQ